MRYRYELLREAPVIPHILHPSVGLGILKRMKNRPAVGYSSEPFTMPWWEQIKFENLRLAVARVGKYPGGVEQDYYFVERLVPDPRFVVRSQVYDCEGYPLKSSATPVQFSLCLGDALRIRSQYAIADKDRFYDIFPQDI